HERGVPVEAVEDAFVLAAARRLIQPAPRHASGNDPFPGILRSGDRRGPADASRPGILSIPPLQTPTCRLGTIDARPSPNESPSPRNAPPARMIPPVP